MLAETDGLSERILTMTVARRFYVDRRAKSDIADELGISRFRVARMLDRALRDGLVRIEFQQSGSHVNYELSSSLKLRFGLRHAVVVDDHGGDTDKVLDSMGKVAAELLREISGPDEILGFAWTRVMEAMAAHLEPLRARAVVQLGGAWPGAGTGRTSVDLVRDMAHLTRGEAFLYYAPLIASDAQSAEAIRRQPDVVAARAMFPRVTLAIVGLGAWQAGGSSLWSALGPEQRARVAEQGTLVEICGSTLDAQGCPVHSELSAMSIGMSAAELISCPDVLALAFGEEKSDAIAAAIRGKAVKSLITHEAVARRMLRRKQEAG